MSIVPTNVNYNSTLLIQNLIMLNRIYPFLNIQSAGTSVLGKNIYVVKLGNGTKKVFYSGSIHR
jgi:g-D-glutamyl-meso-diaminopimelate peptidase